jgi:hypothetical protein
MSLYPASIDTADLDGTNGFVIENDGSPQYTGWSVAGAGDINGDGIADMLVGTPDCYGGNGYVIYGKAGGFGAVLSLNGLPVADGISIHTTGFDYVGRNVVAAGDVNGDGLADILIGASGAYNNGYDSGSAYVLFGTAFSGNISLYSLAITGIGFRADGAAAGDEAGIAVSSAGDLNGDGFDDILIGASRSDVNGTNSGAAYVVFGKGTLFADSFVLSDLDGTNGFAMSGTAANQGLGRALSGAGDVNGDGFDDFIVGTAAGVSYVVFGGASLSSGNLSTLDGTNGFKIDRGGNVATAGDVNADGFADLIVNNNGDHAAYVVFGKASGFASTLSVSSLDGSNGFALTSASYVSSVAGAGDVNGDGFADLILGHQAAYGEAFVVFGKASGFGAAIALSSLDGDNGFHISSSTYGYAGYAVAGAGDVNGDGFDDVMIGAPYVDYTTGAAYVVLGGMPNAAVTRNGTAIGNTIHGGAFGDTLVGLGGKDDLIGLDGNDTLDGGGGGDTLDGGAGHDLLLGFKGNDTLLGGLQDDVLNGGRGADRMDGGKGNDTFVYADAGDSTGTAHDTLVAFDPLRDLLDVANAVTGIDPLLHHGALSSKTFDSDLTAAINGAVLGANHAMLFIATSGTLAGKTFLIVDQNGTAGYQSGEDLVMAMESLKHPTSLATGDFV